MPKIIDPRTLAQFVTQNQNTPDEGPLVVPVLLDFSQGNTLRLDQLLAQQLTIFPSMIQSIFIDMAGRLPVSNLQVIAEQTGQLIWAKINTQGYYTLLSPNPPRLIFFNTSGVDQIQVFLFNVAIPGAVWSTL